ncbi:hypothetical protein Acr_08g0000340 [Actinidia rufa]|uniref:Uncharacterized protein n=1 Tax=Actinidia rufa TaxID=165716 RepID=A0A7J0EYZ3_9ERIC|nr:hypothetical protein Acr_08g0000340 [Actinidia rufa]
MWEWDEEEVHFVRISSEELTVEEGVVELGLGGGGEMEGFGWVVGVGFELGGHFVVIEEEECWEREVGGRLERGGGGLEGE